MCREIRTYYGHRNGGKGAGVVRTKKDEVNLYAKYRVFGF